MRSIRAKHDPPDRRATFASACVLFGALGCHEPLASPMSGSDAPDRAPRRGGTLHLASFADVRNLDPAGPSDGLSVQAQHLLFAGLVDFDENGRVVPDLADHWNI